MAGKAIDPEEKIPQGMSAQTLTPTFRKKFRNVKELTNHAMQHWKQELLKPFYEADAKERQRCGQGGVLLPVKVPEAKADSRDAADLDPNIVEKIPQCKRTDKSRDAAGKAVGVNGRYVSEEV